MPLSTASYSKEEIKAKFRTKLLSQIDGKPAYKTISKIKKEVYANAAAVPTTLGDGHHGHVGLVAPSTVYSALSSKKYTAQKEHRMQQKVSKQQIKTAVDKKYLEGLIKPLVGYMNITAQDMINHLMDWYGHITSSDVKENNKCINELINIDEPISTYFHRVENASILQKMQRLPPQMNKFYSVWNM
eukprot:11469587-Ditylum_brightwellii.AAC.1